MINSGWIKLGVVGRAHGIRGSFFVSGRDEALPKEAKVLNIGPSIESAKTFHVESALFQNGRAVLKCQELNSRDQAELLTGHGVWIDKSLIKVDDSKEFLLLDLKGRLVEDVNAESVGSVADVIVYPGGINLSILNTLKTKELDIPMSPDYVDMDFKTGTGTLKLTVPISTFDEIWNDLKPSARNKPK